MPPTRPSPTNQMMLAILILGLFVFLILELSGVKFSRPQPSPTLVNTNSVNNLQVRAGLSNALDRVYADLAKATNATEIASLRTMEYAITNSLK